MLRRAAPARPPPAVDSAARRGADWHSCTAASPAVGALARGRGGPACPAARRAGTSGGCWGVSAQVADCMPGRLTCAALPAHAVLPAAHRQMGRADAGHCHRPLWAQDAVEKLDWRRRSRRHSRPQFGLQMSFGLLLRPHMPEAASVPPVRQLSWGEFALCPCLSPAWRLSAVIGDSQRSECGVR